MPRHSRNANQFLPVYCRENARESRFKNHRGKICPYFAHFHNSLTTSLLTPCISILPNKHKC